MDCPWADANAPGGQRHFADTHRTGREVIADPDAPYFGAELSGTHSSPALTPAGETRFEDWPNQSLTGHYAPTGGNS